MDKLLHERLRESKKGQSWIGVRPYDDEFILWRSDAERLADEIERYYIPRPRFEDGEPAKFGEELENGKRIANITYHIGGRCTINDTATWQGTCESDYELKNNETLKRPTPKVLDADGVEIKVGDTVYIFNGRGKGKKVVVSKFGSTEAPGTYDIPNLVVFDTPENVLTDGVDFALTKDVCHEKPVFDAEGVRICKGDTVWYLIDGKTKITVESFKVELGKTFVCGNGYSLQPQNTCHREPDSLEKLRDDLCNKGDWHEMSRDDLGALFMGVCSRLTALIDRGA